MNRYKKDLIINGIIIPAIAAVVLTALFFAVLNNFSKDFPFIRNTVIVSDYERADVTEAETLTLQSEGDSISKTDLYAPTDNMILGSANANGNSLELIFNANDVNAIKRLNIASDSKLVGETGTVFATCYKSDSQLVKSLKIGDIVNLDVNYGSYAYKVTAVTAANSLADAKKMGDGIARALVLCTDSSNSIGISDSYLTVVCEMTSGKAVTE